MSWKKSAFGVLQYYKWSGLYLKGMVYVKVNAFVDAKAQCPYPSEKERIKYNNQSDCHEIYFNDTMALFLFPSCAIH